jgi:hypothetical protein
VTYASRCSRRDAEAGKLSISKVILLQVLYSKIARVTPEQGPSRRSIFTVGPRACVHFSVTVEERPPLYSFETGPLAGYGEQKTNVASQTESPTHVRFQVSAMEHQKRRVRRGRRSSQLLRSMRRYRNIVVNRESHEKL